MYSLTQGGNLTALAGLIATLLKSFFGIELVPDSVEKVLIAVGIIISWIGRYRKGDLTVVGFRKS